MKAEKENQENVTLHQKLLQNKKNQMYEYTKILLIVLDLKICYS